MQFNFVNAYKKFKSNKLFNNFYLKFLNLSYFMFTIIYLLAFSYCLNFDSYLNSYKDTNYEINTEKDVSNSTWKEVVVADKLVNLIKCMPVYIDNDDDIDLLVLDSETKLYWVSNIRGTSGTFFHQFVSHSKLLDFVVHGDGLQDNSNNYYSNSNIYKNSYEKDPEDTLIKEDNNLNNKNFYILGIHSKGKKIQKFNSYHNPANNSMNWSESTFFELRESIIDFPITDSLITGINLYPYSINKQYLFLTVQNFSGQVQVIKIVIENQIISHLSLIQLPKLSTIIGAFDMNMDGYVDLLYLDNKNNIYCLVNNDPYYYSVFISSIYKINNYNRNKKIPRIYISDNNHDKYPDIIVGNSLDNSIGLLFNPGKYFWENAKLDFFRNNMSGLNNNKYNNSPNSNSIVDNRGLDSSKKWVYVPLFDSRELNNDNENSYFYNNEKKLIDFTIIPTKRSLVKRINFEIFALYDKDFYWFIEKSLKLSTSIDWTNKASHQPKNYIYCMKKNTIVIDKVKDFTRESNSYDLIIDLDINKDGNPEFILYYLDSLFMIKKYTPYITGFGWNANFWIYVCLYIYVVCSFIGLYEFYKLSWLNNRIKEEKLLLLPEEYNAKEMEEK